MPRIPTPASQGAQNIGNVALQTNVNTTLQNLNPSQDVFQSSAGNLARGLSEAAPGVVDFLSEIHAKEQDAKTLEAENLLRQYDRSYREDPENGINVKQGKDTFGATEKAAEDYKSEIERIIEEQGLKGAHAEAFTLKAASLRNGSLDRIAAHERNQTVEFQKGQRQAKLDNYSDMLATNSSDEEMVNRSVVGIIEQAQMLADDAGISDEQRGEYVEDIIASSMGNAIDGALANGDPVTGKRLLEVAKSMGVSGSQYKALKDKVDGDMREVEVNDHADVIMQKYGGDLGAALQAVRDGKVPADMENDVVAAVKTRFQEQELARNYQITQRYRAMEERVQAGYKPTPSQLQGLPTDMQEALIAEANHYAKLQADPEYVRVTDATALEDFMGTTDSQLAGMSKDEFVAKFKPRMSEGDFRSALTRWASASEANRKKAETDGVKLNYTPMEGKERTSMKSYVSQLPNWPTKTADQSKFLLRVENEFNETLRVRMANPNAEPMNALQRNELLRQIAFGQVEYVDTDFIDTQEAVGASTASSVEIRDMAESLDFNEDQFEEAYFPIIREIRANGGVASMESIRNEYEFAVGNAPKNPSLFVRALPQIRQLIQEKTGMPATQEQIQAFWEDNSSLYGYDARGSR